MTIAKHAPYDLVVDHDARGFFPIVREDGVESRDWRDWRMPRYETEALARDALAAHVASLNAIARGRTVVIRVDGELYDREAETPSYTLWDEEMELNALRDRTTG